MSAKTKKHSDPCNPYSVSRMANSLSSSGRRQKPPEHRVSNRTASSTLTSYFSSQPPPRKKVRTEGRKKPPLAPEERDIIDIDNDVERIESSSSDELLMSEPRRDRPGLDTRDGGRHAFDVESDGLQPNAVASTSRVRQDGPSTQALEKELRNRSNSPISQFADDEQQSPSKVMEIVDLYENIEKTKHVDLRSVKKSMKPKNPLDPVATSSSGFRQNKFFIAREYTLPLKACYIGRKLMPENSIGPSIYLTWSPSGNNLSISCKADGQSITLVGLDTDTHVAYIEHAELPSLTENHDDTPIVKMILRRGSFIKLQDVNPNSMPVKSHVDHIIMKLDPSNQEWAKGKYTQLFKWLQQNKVKTSQSRNAKQIWEMAECSASQDPDSEVGFQQGEGPLSRVSWGSRTSGARSQTDTPPDVPNAPKSDAMNDQPFEPRRSTRIRTVKKPSPPVDPDEVILVYPQGIPGAINITNADVGRLQPGEFLNDTVIEFGLKLWHKELEASDPELAKQVHVFSSFFYKKLNKRNLEEGYESVRKWTSKIDLFAKKYIIIPINEHLHWYLAIIYMPEHILLPPPPTPIRQSAASRTRSRTSNAAKEEIKDAKDAEHIGGATENATLSLASGMEEEHELDKHMDEFSRTVTVAITEGNSLDGMNMDTSLDEPARQESHHPSTLSRPVHEFAMDVDHVDKSEEDAVREQLRMTSPAVSELGSDRVLSNSAQQGIEDMDTETKPAGKQTDIVSSRFFVTEPESQVVEQGQRVTEASTTGDKPDERVREEDPDQSLEDEARQQDSGIDPSQRTYIFTLDSLGSRHYQAAKQLNRYLKMEAEDKLNVSNTSDAIGRTAAVPTQPNFCDCGIYLLHFAQTFMTDPTKYFYVITKDNKKSSLPASERQTIWQGHKIGSKRQDLSDRIKKLSEEWKKSRAAKGEARKDQAEVTQETDSSDIEYVDVTPAVAPGVAKTTKGSSIRKTKRIRG
ncbi:hypothetical protein AX15_000039 [Amanita polypyramis BW_CC]|nr:hypothetical protein AX15_000039 [Amanita polypyramis BW_CC]